MFRTAFIVFHAVQGLACAAAVIQLPSVPTGGALQAQVTLSIPGQSQQSLSNIPITLTTSNNCGNFGGASSLNVVTNSAATFFFTMTAGSVPGVCTIEGRNGSTVGTAATTIYRPSDVSVSTATPLVSALVNSSALVTLKASAAGVALWGVPVTIDPLPASGASATPVPLATATNQQGVIDIDFHTNNVAGIYDVVARAGDKTQVLRIAQRVAVAGPDPTGRQVRVQGLPTGYGTVTASLVTAPTGCGIENAIYSQDPSDTIPSPAMLGFPQGTVQLRIVNCPRSTIQVKLEYPDALPTDGVAQVSTTSASNWATLPYTLSGKTVTLTLVDDGTGDRSASGGVILATVGVAKPGSRASLPPKPTVHDMWWAGAVENGWGMSIAQSADANLFAAIYAYDDAGKPTWWVIPGGNWDLNHVSFAGDFYAPYGTPWYAYDTRLTVNGSILGPLKLTVLGADTATIDYTIGGVTGHKSVQRQVFGADAVSPLANLGGMWWGGVAQSGWGVSIVQQHATLFAVWYTYDELNHPTWFVMPGGGWTGADTYEGRMYRTHGSPWLGHAYDASKLQVTDVGPYRIKFSGTNATLEYSVEGRTGTLALTRQAPF